MGMAKTLENLNRTAPPSPQNPQLFWSVAPGDSLWKIASQTPGISGEASIAAQVQKLIQLNPHITDPDRIFPNEILVLGSQKINSIASPLSQSAIKQISDTWKRASPEAREIVQKNFDIIGWLSD